MTRTKVQAQPTLHLGDYFLAETPKGEKVMVQVNGGGTVKIYRSSGMALPENGERRAIAYGFTPIEGEVDGIFFENGDIPEDVMPTIEKMQTRLRQKYPTASV